MPRIKFSPKYKRRLIILFIVLVLFFFTPQVLLILFSGDEIYSDLSVLPAQEYGLVFGAQVYDNQALSDVTKERIDGAILLYNAGKIEKLFISGDNRHNDEVDSIAGYAVDQGVSRKDIVTDYLGIDTHDTCQHFKEIGPKAAILVSQTFHLPRAIYMCGKNGIRGFGWAVNKLGLLESRGTNIVQIYSIRLIRLVRESLLTWLFISGIYDLLSNEAETMPPPLTNSP